MPSLVNRVPPGLLSLLGIKALGINPSILPDELQPNLDITSLYAVANSELLGGTTAAVGAPGVSAVSALLVPAGEIWIMNRGALYATANLGAGTTYRIRLAIYDSPNQRIVQVSPAATAAATERVSTSIDGPIIMVPGEQLVAYCEQFAGIAQTLRIDAKITRLAV